MNCTTGPTPAPGYVSRSLPDEPCNRKAFAATLAYVCLALDIFAV